MRFLKKRGAREIVWGPEQPWIEPKKEIVLGPADTSPTSSSDSEDSGMGFFGTMASANSGNPGSGSSSSSKSPYGWEPNESTPGSILDSETNSDGFEKIMRLQRKIDNLVERIEFLEKKILER